MFDYSQLVYNYNTVIAVHTDTEVVAYNYYHYEFDFCKSFPPNQECELYLCVSQKLYAHWSLARVYALLFSRHGKAKPGPVVSYSGMFSWV